MSKYIDLRRMCSNRGRCPTFLVISLLMLVISSYFINSIYRPLGGSAPPDRGYPPLNFIVYYNAASAVLDGLGNQIYDPVAMEAHYYTQHTTEDNGNTIHVALYDYPPFFLSIIAPLEHFQMVSAEIVWVVLCQVFMIVGVVFLLLSTRNLNKVGKLTVVVLAMLMTPVYFTILSGNVNTLIFMLLAMSLFFLMRDREWLAGIPLGLAIVIKLVPAVLLAYLLIKGKLKALLTSLAAIGAGVAVGVWFVGWDSFSYYIRVLLPEMGWFSRMQFDNGPNKFMTINQSIHGLILHLFSTSPDGMFTGLTDSWNTVIVLTVIACSAVVLGAFWYVWRSANDASSLAMGFGMFVAVGLMVSAATWTDHLVLMIIPVAVALDYLAASEKDDLFYRMVWLAGGFTLVAMNYPFNNKDMDNSWGWFFVVPALYGMLIVYFTLASLMRHRRKALQAAATQQAPDAEAGMPEAELQVSQ